MLRSFCLLFLFVCSCGLGAGETIFLRDNLKTAKSGDYIVAMQNKSYTLLHIYNRNADNLIIEEITVPMGRVNISAVNWREWVMKGAPGNTSWILYAIDLNTAKPQKYFSVTRNGWFEMPERENFMATLLNLRMEKLSSKERKKVGVAVIPNSESRQVWNPKLIVEGMEIPHAEFEAWKTKWPQDGTEIAGKTIEVYTPTDPRYPSYFPYWLQISGTVGNAKVRIVDSGTNLVSPAPPVFDLSTQ